jgi:hypothetical protein
LGRFGKGGAYLGKRVEGDWKTGRPVGPVGKAGEAFWEMNVGTKWKVRSSCETPKFFFGTSHE